MFKIGFNSTVQSRRRSYVYGLYDEPDEVKMESSCKVKELKKDFKSEINKLITLLQEKKNLYQDSITHVSAVNNEIV